MKEPTNQELYQAAYSHITHVLDDIGQRTGYRWPNLKICLMGNTIDCYHELCDGQNKIVLGGIAVRFAMDRGFAEYPELSWIVPAWRYKGAHAFYYIVTHELAHYIHITRWQNGDAVYQEPHDANYVNVYLELLHDYPFEKTRQFYEHLEAQPAYA